MRYEIITDKENLLVLVVNSRVVLVTSEMSDIFTEIQKDYETFRKHTKREYNKATIAPKTEEKTETKTTLGKLLEL